jgi:hypothetical protein
MTALLLPLPCVHLRSVLLDAIAGLALHMFWGRGREEKSKLTLVLCVCVCACVCLCVCKAIESSRHIERMLRTGVCLAVRARFSRGNRVLIGSVRMACIFTGSPARVHTVGFRCAFLGHS